MARKNRNRGKSRRPRLPANEALYLALVVIAGLAIGAVCVWIAKVF